MMKFRAMIVLLAALCALSAPRVAAADDSEFANSKVQVADLDGDKGYRVTANPVYASIRQKMMNRQVLEEYAKFLSPIRLPKTLWIYAEECQGGSGASPHYSPDQRAMVMCYQFMKIVEDRANVIVQVEAKNPRMFPMKVTRNGFIAGVFAGVIMHETGHALFDILEVPIYGREEDAADEMSTFVALQFSKPLADLVIASYADIAETFTNPPTQDPNTSDPNYPKDKTMQCFEDPFCAFSDEHGTWGQRFFNTLCLTYGSDPQHYAFLETGHWLPPDRDCAAEYKQIYHAFASTIYPFIDQKQRALVQAHAWFRSTELK